MTIEMKKTNRKQSDNRSTMIVKHLDEENTDQFEFECKTCKKRFKTYHGLAGHRATHKKIKPINEYHDALCRLSLDVTPTLSYWLHQCKICMKEFETGRQLGGHMNLHRFEKGLNVVEEEGSSRQEAEKEKVEGGLESGDSSVLTMVELERRKAEEDERVRVRTELVLAAKKLQLFLD